MGEWSKKIGEYGENLVERDSFLLLGGMILLKASQFHAICKTENIKMIKKSP